MGEFQYPFAFFLETPGNPYSAVSPNNIGIMTGRLFPNIVHLVSKLETQIHRSGLPDGGRGNIFPGMEAKAGSGTETTSV